MSETVVVEKKKPMTFEEFIKKLKELKEKESQLVKRTATDLIRIKYDIGKLMLEYRPNIPYGKIGEFVERASTETGYKKTELYACMKFAMKYESPYDMPQISAISEKLKQLTWGDVEHQLLYDKETKIDTEIDEQIQNEIKEVPTPTTQEGLAEQMEKMCQLEKDLHQMLLILERKRSETLKCEECEIRPWCNKARPKILTVGTELADLEA